MLLSVSRNKSLSLGEVCINVLLGRRVASQKEWEKVAR